MNRLRALASNSFVSNLPVHVRRGLCKGAKWTVFPASSYWRGTIKGDLSDIVREYGCCPDAVAWDIGAHFGYYAVAMARAGARVYAFEPSEYSFTKLSKHIALNSLSNVTAIKAAASDIKGTARIYADSTGASTAHLDKRSADLDGANGIIQTLRLDDLTESEEIRPPVFIKIDVEGHGSQVIEGGIRTILKYKPVIVMDWHTSEEVHAARTLLSSDYVLLDLNKLPLEWNFPGDASLLLPRNFK